MRYLVANWKSNKTIAETKEWFQMLNAQCLTLNEENIKVIICAPFTLLYPLKKLIINNSALIIHLGAQDLSPFPSGAYTGAISAEMLQGLVDYVLVGHSERRRYFGETNEMVVKKVKMALKYKITPIVCLDEPYLETQVQGLIFAYEPLAAISSGKPDTPENANRVAEKIKNMTKQAPVLYGGSVNSKNAREFILEENIDGLLVGQASLGAKQFIKIIENAKTQA